MAPFTGLTWDHPRGYNALAAAARDGDVLQWDKQPLEGFESAPIAKLCADYDLVVLDHPHLGEALAKQCLIPLDSVLPDGELRRVAKQSIGRSFESYQMAGHLFALPLDAATQVMAYRQDLISDCPTLWSEVIVRAQQKGDVALCLAGPHAILSLMSIASALDPNLDLRDASSWIDRALCQEAYGILQAVHAHAVRGTEALNPIAMLQAMADEVSADRSISNETRLALCPLIYGYVNYSRPPQRTQLRFADAPRVHVDGRPGSILGGTGIAISRRTVVTEQLIAHLSWLLSVDAQTSFIPHHDGQPSARTAWADETVNTACADFYAATSATLEAATVRPRFDGYITFQSEASECVRAALAEGHGAAVVTDALTEQFNAHFSNQGGGG